MAITSNHNDIELFEGIAAGDEGAFYQFYNRYRPQLRSFALSFTRSGTDADDILQETFMRIWLSRDTISKVENPRAWVFTVNARVCLDYIRRQVNQRKKIDQIPQIENAALPTPFDLVHLNEIHHIVQKTIKQMPPKRRRIFRMSRDEGKKPAEIAESLGLSGGTVRNVLAVALKEIRDGLAAAGYTLLTLPYLIYIFF
ncbi:RNA polymerase sigma factor [Niastella vici]|uniref:RNA polymerase sigma factor n=1 Tax=Niastella vici TaxID=1703345 RepID=UPI001301F84B|nr:RNA polymerase sigma-70 factor [Niastella vici]